MELRRQQRRQADGSGADDGHRVSRLDGAVEHAALVAGWQDVAEHYHRVLVRSLGAAPGILLAAVPFGVLHFHEYGNSWRHAVILSLAGAAFGVMRHATRSTKASALMHASYNALIFIALMTQKGILPHL